MRRQCPGSHQLVSRIFVYMILFLARLATFMPAGERAQSSCGKRGTAAPPHVRKRLLHLLQLLVCYVCVCVCASDLRSRGFVRNWRNISSPSEMILFAAKPISLRQREFSIEFLVRALATTPANQFG